MSKSNKPRTPKTSLMAVKTPSRRAVEFTQEFPPEERRAAWTFICALLKDEALPYEARRYILTKGTDLHARLEDGVAIDANGIAKRLMELIAQGK